MGLSIIETLVVFAGIPLAVVAVIYGLVYAGSARSNDRRYRPGRPFDFQSQAETLELALRVLETAPAARTTVQSPQRWTLDAEWKKDFNDLSKLSPDQIAERRKEFKAVKAVAKSKREGT